MKNQLIAGMLIASLVLPASAFAEVRHDRKLEQAAIAIAVSKLGDLRGGLSYDAEPVTALPLDLNKTASVATTGGLAVAVERKAARLPL